MFKNIKNKDECIFIQFDYFYPTQENQLCSNWLVSFAKQQEKKQFATHTQKSFISHEDEVWTKKLIPNFDTAMGAYEYYECECICIYLSDRLRNLFIIYNIALYKDDGIIQFRKTSFRQTDIKTKELCKFY